MTDSGIPEVKQPSLINGPQIEALSKTSGSVASIKSNSSWDDDWVTSTKKGASISSQNSVSASSNSILSNPAVQGTFLQQHLPVSSVSNQHTTMSLPSEGAEWPPRKSSDVASQFGDAERHVKVQGTSSVSSFGDIDPFADWPPRPSSSSGLSGISKNGTLGPPANNSNYNSMSGNSNSMNFKTNSSWSVGSQNSAEPIGLNLVNASSTTSNLNGGLNSLNSLGFLEQNQGFPPLNASRPESKSTDIGSIFASNKNDQIAPRLAPPPSTAVGRGRGRGRARGTASTGRSTNAKSQSEQPPLLDLLG